MELIRTKKTVTVTQEVYSKQVELTPPQAAILYKLLNKSAGEVAEFVDMAEGWTPYLETAHYDLWCKFFGDSDMGSVVANGILTGLLND